MGAEKAVQEAFDGIKEALMSNDIQAIEERFDDAYCGQNLRGGVEDRDVVIEAYRPGNVKLTTYDVKECKIEVFREIALISGTAYLAGKYEDIDFEHHLRFIDIFIHRQSGWKYYLSQGTEIISNEDSATS